MPAVSSKFYIENKNFSKSLPYRMNLFCPDNINQKELWCPRSLQTSRINNSGRRVFLDPKNPSGQALVIFWIQKHPLPSLLMLSVWRDLAHHSSFIYNIIMIQLFVCEKSGAIYPKYHYNHYYHSHIICVQILKATDSTTIRLYIDFKILDSISASLLQ